MEPIEAKVVGVDPSIEPIKSVVVADQRNTFGKRIGTLALALLLLFFGISGYIQSAKNGSDLNQAKHDRSRLISSLNNISQTNNEQTKLIKQLQAAIRAQNTILEKHGLEPVPVPQSTVIFQPGVQPSSRPEPSQSPSAKPRPSVSASPTTTPSSQPTDKVKKTICDLTGVCALFNLFALIF